MQVYIFKSRSERDLYGATQEVSGGNLPKDYAPWELKKGPVEWKPGDAPRIGVDAKTGMSAIGDDGYYLWKTKVTVEFSNPD